MNKRLIVLAVAAAASAPVAMADDSTVTLYGTLNVDFENVKADGCTGATSPVTGCFTGVSVPPVAGSVTTGGGISNVGRRNRVSSNSSNIGFRGTEELGGGLKAVFQVESTVSMDGSAVNGFASRNSKLGLAGGFGEIFLGNWDTPYKIATGPVDAFYGTGIANYANVLSGNSTVTAANVASRSSFDRRQNNVIHYISPNLSGFSARVAYSANEQKSADTVAAGSFTQDPSLWSTSVNFSNGPLFVALAYERHDEYGNAFIPAVPPTVPVTGSTSTSKDDGWKLSGTYTLFGTTTIGLAAERLKFKGNLVSAGAFVLPKIVNIGTTAADEAKIDSFYASLVHKMGPHAIRAVYGQDRGVKLSGGVGSSDNNTKAKMWALGYSFSFSKRTDLYALYTQIKNDDNSRNDFAINPVGSIANGSDPTGFGVGLRHTF